MNQNPQYTAFENLVGKERLIALSNLGVNISEVAALTGHNLRHSIKDYQKLDPPRTSIKRLAEVLSLYRVMKTVEPDIPEETALSLIAMAVSNNFEDAPAYVDQFMPEKKNQALSKDSPQ